MARTPLLCEVKLTSGDVVAESSDCNAISDKTAIATPLRGHLLSHFDDFLVDGEVTTIEK